jgi:thiamine pyrophosphate-dependent acetolactate synthase large subunit-like protein
MEPIGLRHGMKAADIYVRADAKLALTELLKALRKRGNAKAQIRSPELERRIRDEPADDATFSIAPGLLDPRAVIAELDRVIPKDYDSVSGSGHQSYFHSVMRGRKPENYHAMRDFGAIGNGISFAIGVAAARKDGKTVLFEGDGSLLMHIQEFEAIQRHGLKLLICVLNDGAYGSEIHKLRADGLDDSGSIFGRTDLAAIAKGFGLRGATVTDIGQFQSLFEAYQAQDKAELWNIHVSDQVVNPGTRRALKVGHGKM